ncbi:MAG: hypothetical protein KAH20_09930 [Methylococcales bacterium]|nr:hypothetical protein [Methylococcales bacterium]
MKITRLLLVNVLSFILLGNVVAETLPTTSKTPNIKLNAEENGKTLTFTFWREALAGKNTFLMKVESAATSDIFICGSSFKVIQNGKEFTSLKLNSGDSAKQCHVFRTGRTFKFDQVASNKFDDQAAFSIAYNTKTVDIPAHAGAVSGGTIVNKKLDIHMSSATYQTPQGSLNISADLEFKGVDGNGDYIWKLKSYKLNQ